MTQSDRNKLRAYFGSPQGRQVLDEINRAYYEKMAALAREEAPFWRDKDGNRIEAEAASSEPLDPQRPFPRPMPLARPVSVNWLMLAAWLTCALSMGGLLGWIVYATIRRYT